MKIFPFILILIFSSSLSWSLTFKNGVQQLEDKSSKSLSCPYNKILKESESVSHDHLDIEIMENFAPAVITFLPRYESFTTGNEIQYLQPGNSSSEIKLIADFNNDGFDDIMIEAFMTDTPPVFMISNGDGTFIEEKNFTNNASRRQIRKASSADLNNDGWIDIVGFTTSDHFDPMGWVRGEPDILLINQKGQGFEEVIIPEWHKNDYNHGGDLADINNDGLIDILPVAEDPNKPTGPLINKGNNKYVLAPYQYSNLVSNGSSSSLDTGDLNNDGFVDFVFAITTLSQEGLTEKNLDSSSVHVIYGDGDFDFRDNLTLEFGNHWISPKKLKELKQNEDLFEEGGRQDLNNLHRTKGFVDGGSSNVQLIDLNNDGLLDILMGHWIAPNPLWMTSGFKAYINDGTCFSDQTNSFFPNQRMNRELTPNQQTAYIHQFFFEDITGDNLPDLILKMDGTMSYTESEEIYFPYIFINNGSNKYLPILKSKAPFAPTPKYRNFGSPFRNDMHSFGDFDGDGRADLVFINREHHAYRMYVHLQRSEKELQDAEKIQQEFLSEAQGRYPVEFFHNINGEEIIAKAELSIVRKVAVIQNVEFMNDKYPNTNLKGVRGYINKNKNIEIWAKQQTVNGFGECLYFNGDLLSGYELANQQFDFGMKGINNCRDKDNIWPINLRLIPKEFSLQLSWATITNGPYVLEAQDKIIYSFDKSSDPKKVLIKNIIYENFSTEGEAHGREDLEIKLLDENFISIVGKIQLFPGEFLDLNILEPIASSKVILPFSNSDQLIISWE